MAACRGCGVELPGRRQKCNTCKGATGKVHTTKPRPRRSRSSAAPLAKKAPAKKAAAAKRPARRPASKAAAPSKAAAKKTTGAKKTSTRKPAVRPPQRRVGVLAELRPRGAKMWAQLAVELDSPAGAIALEVCRAVDRLDELDRIISGKGVLQLLMFRLKADLEMLVDPSTTEVKVKIDMAGVLSETRGQQSNLAAMLSTLGLSKTGVRPAAPTPTPAAPTSPLDELNARREQREQAT